MGGVGTVLTSCTGKEKKKKKESNPGNHRLTNPEGYTQCHWISVEDHMGLFVVYVNVL